MVINRTLPTVGFNQGSNRIASPPPNATARDPRLRSIMGFRHLPSRSNAIMPDDELKERVREIARNDAARGEFDWHGGEFTKLRYAFMNTAAPDRHGFIRNHPIMRAFQNFGLWPQGVVWFGGHSHFCPQSGWHADITPGESARLQEISDVYHEAWMQARYGTGGDPSADTGVVHVQSRFDSRA